MALKLFHETGFSALLKPGETRVAPHPARMVTAVSLWVGLACNPGLWRLLSGADDAWRPALAALALLAGGTALFAGIVGRRRTLRLALSLALVAGALFAIGVWSAHLAVDVLWQERPRTWVPSWSSFLQWRVLALMLVLAVLPIVAVWTARMRRLSGPSQLRANALCTITGAVIAGAGIFLL